MPKYFVAVNTENGSLLDGFAYENEDRTLPSPFEYKSFSESCDDYELLYALFVHDENRITTTPPDIYIHPQMGGVTYDYDNEKFLCQKEDLSIDMDLLRKIRNQLLDTADALTFVTDYDESTKQKLLDYRQNLRDMTDKVTDGTWKTKYDVVWPQIPEEVHL